MKTSTSTISYGSSDHSHRRLLVRMSVSYAVQKLRSSSLISRLLRLLVSPRWLSICRGENSISNNKMRFFPLTPTPPSHSDTSGRQTRTINDDGSETHEQIWEDEKGTRKVRVRSWHCGMGGGGKGVNQTASSMRSSVNGTGVQDQQQHVMSANTNRHNESKQPHNLFVLETALRTSYRAGFRDALKLSPFMPFASSPTPGSDELTPPHLSASSTNREKGFTTPLLILCTGAILLGTTTSAILAYRSLGRFRSLEKRLDKSLSVIWSMDNNTSEGIRKLTGELKSVKGLVLDSSPLIGLRDKALGLGGMVMPIDKKGITVPPSTSDGDGGGGTQGTKVDTTKDVGSENTRIKNTNPDPTLPPTAAIQPAHMATTTDQLKSIDRRLSEIQNAFKDFVQDSDDHWRAVFTLEEQVGAMSADVRSIVGKFENLQGILIQSKLTERKDDHQQQTSLGEQARLEPLEKSSKEGSTKSSDNKDQVSTPSTDLKIPPLPGTAAATSAPALAPEVMPINDIRKAIEDIKASYLLDEKKVDKAIEGDQIDKTATLQTQSAGAPTPPAKLDQSAMPKTAESTTQVDNSSVQTEAIASKQTLKSASNLAAGAETATATKAESGSASTAKATEPSPSKAASTTSTTNADATATKVKGRTLPDISDKMTNLRIDTSGLWTISPYIRHSQTADDKTGMRIGRGSWPPASWFPAHWGCAEQKMAEVILSFDERGWLEHRSGRGNKRPKSYAFQTRICGLNDPSQGGRTLQIYIDGRWWVVRNEPLCDTFEDRWTIRQRLPEGYVPGHGHGLGHEDGWLESAERALARWIRFK